MPKIRKVKIFANNTLKIIFVTSRLGWCLKLKTLIISSRAQKQEWDEDLLKGNNLNISKFFIHIRTLNLRRSTLQTPQNFQFMLYI